MPKIVDFEHAYARRIQREQRVRIPFLDADAAHPDRPYALMNRLEPGCTAEPHFHSGDQWQFIAEGRAILGREHIEPYCIHFNRAYTPYGPLTAEGDGMAAYFDLYNRYQPGAFHIVGPEASQNMAFLKRIENRRPWQIKRRVTFPSQHGGIRVKEPRLERVPDIHDGNGLAAHSLALPPNAKYRAPDPACGGGQYIVVVNGTLQDAGTERNAYAMIFTEPSEGPYELCAGADGLEALVLDFPRSSYTPVIWRCGSCKFAFDERERLPAGGIAFGNRWRDLPRNWACPQCGASRTQFALEQVE